MTTLQAYSHTETKVFPIPSHSMDATLNRLSSSLTQATSETANAFFGPLIPPPLPNSGPAESGSRTCSQRNIGEKFEMLLNLEVAKAEWQRLFTAGESERFKQDTFCEMANCICGTLLSDPNFSDAFGYMIPCVPWSASAKPQKDSSTLRGAFRLSGILVYFSISVQLSR